MTNAQQLRDRVLRELKNEFCRFTDDPRNSGHNPADNPAIRLLSDVADFLEPLDGAHGSKQTEARVSPA